MASRLTNIASLGTQVIEVLLLTKLLVMSFVS